MFAQLAAIVLAATSVVAHGGVLSYSNAGKFYNGFVPYNTATGQTSIQREWDTYNPIQDATDPTLACNNAGGSLALQQTATVAAGSTITAYWNQIWPHNTGPVLTYLASCGTGSCTGVSSTTLKWFKIQQAGLISGTVATGTWAAGQMIANNNSWTTTIPSTVPSGNYLIRFETIALHSQPAQWYPECAQILITGGGTLQPTAAQLVTFPGGYSNTDPGTAIDIYGQAAQTQTTYVIPGPPLYGSASTGGSSTTAKPTTTAPGTTTTKPTTTAAPTTTASGPTATHFGQCGGQGWTGPTVCAAPYTCTSSSVYYSQCL